MTDARTISSYFEDDHDRLDELFKSFQTLKRSNFDKAKDAFTQFRFGLQRHIEWEEELLFPLWEEKTGMYESGPTVVMRTEHRRIAEQLEAIHDKVEAQNSDSDAEEQALLGLLAAHNMKEERVLYPSIDGVTTPEERAVVHRKMEEMLQVADILARGNTPP
ncbi:MAG: hemerythrin domain-containing protein [Nitrospira sp.]|nr:hemerythrin domain-containing protein [Nitrospira sp.]